MSESRRSPACENCPHPALCISEARGIVTIRVLGNFLSVSPTELARLGGPAPQLWVVDLHEAECIGASVLTLLCFLREIVHGDARRVILCGVRPRSSHVLGLSGFAEVFRFDAAAARDVPAVN
jgi:anti-anti-sigma regulatory factor